LQKPQSACFPDSVLGLVPDKTKCNIDFIEYMLQYFKIEVQKYSIGSVQENINLGTFENIYFPLPPLPTQTRIASILSSLDDKIELNRRMNQTLEQMAHTLFNHYFVNNIDVGNLPEGWSIKDLKCFGNIVCGKTPSKKVSEYFEGDVPFIKIPDMHKSPFILKTEDSLTQMGANTQKNKFLPAGSLCVSCIATVGLFSITTEPSQTNQQINSIIPSKSIYKYFLYFCLTGLKEHLKMLGGGGTMTLNVNTTLFSNIELVKPPDESITVFDNEVKPLMELLLNNLKENDKLSKIRDTLLPKLMSGEIDVSQLNEEKLEENYATENILNA